TCSSSPRSTSPTSARTRSSRPTRWPPPPSWPPSTTTATSSPAAAATPPRRSGISISTCCPARPATAYRSLGPPAPLAGEAHDLPADEEAAKERRAHKPRSPSRQELNRRSQHSEDRPEYQQPPSHLAPQASETHP